MIFELHALVVDEYNRVPMFGIVTERPLASQCENAIVAIMDVARYETNENILDDGC